MALPPVTYHFRMKCLKFYHFFVLLLLVSLCGCRADTVQNEFSTNKSNHQETPGTNAEVEKAPVSLNNEKNEENSTLRSAVDSSTAKNEASASKVKSDNVHLESNLAPGIFPSRLAPGSLVLREEDLKLLDPAFSHLSFKTTSSPLEKRHWILHRQKIKQPSTTPEQPNRPWLHHGSHDSHHPQSYHLMDEPRPHNLDIFHPGLSAQIDAEQQKQNEILPSNGETDVIEHLDPPNLESSRASRDAAVNQMIDEENESKEYDDELTSNADASVAKKEVSDEKKHATRRKLDGSSEDIELVEQPDPSFTMFTIANTDIGMHYLRLPYREKYLWNTLNAPCHSFDMKIPDERAENSIITLCIFRPNLEFPDETKLLMNSETDNVKKTPQRVFGYVMNNPGSTVYGKIVNSYFYGEVSLMDEEQKVATIYVSEEIEVLNRLMRNNHKTLRHLLMIMNDKARKREKLTVFNAVVTKGASLISFMMYTNPSDVNRNPFMMFTTNHNSYICPGEPQILVDEHGKVNLASGNNNILVDNDGSVHIATPTKEYTFRANGRTIVKEGINVRTLQEHEGSVAVTAYTSSITYDCVLPTPAFQHKRRGGYVCKVCLAVDQQFTEAFLHKQGTSDVTNNYLGKVIDRVSWIFRSIDWDNDKIPDNIGLDYDPQMFHWIYPDVGGEDIPEADIDDELFQSLEGLDFSDCCLGIGYTMKRFKNNELGRRPSAKSTKGPIGVCTRGGEKSSSNLIIISGNSGNFTPITEDQLIYLTAKQIAEALGAAPDGSGQDVCDQFVDGNSTTPRHYIMWPDVLRNTTLKEQSLSSCSKNDIINTLKTCKSSCFDIDLHPFCGNGIVEDGEECDCGSEYSCTLQTCCYSRTGKYPCRKSGIGCQSGAQSISTSKTFPFLLTIFSFILSYQGFTHFLT